jgi:phosphonate transport system substrate-binding protein
MMLITALLGCDRQSYAPVSLQPGAARTRSKANALAPLRVGLAPILSPSSGGEGLVSLCKALSSRLDRPVVPLLGADYRETNDMLALGQLDVGIVCSGAFSDPRLDRVCEPLLVPLLLGTGNSYESFLIVRAQDPAVRLEDLKGREFVFSDSLSLTGFIHPVARLYAMGQTPGHFFSKVSFSRSHDRSIAMVVDGTISAAAVDSSVFMAWREHHPVEAKNIRILERSEPFPAPPLVVRVSLAPEDKAMLRKAFLDLANTEEGKELLKKIGWTGFEVPDARYLARMEQLHRLFGKLRGKNVLPA